MVDPAQMPQNMILVYTVSLIQQILDISRDSKMSLSKIKHYANTPIKMYGKFHLQKTEKKKSDKISDIFHISAQNIDCGYSLEPPR